MREGGGREGGREGGSSKVKDCACPKGESDRRECERKEKVR